jgi:uncharacterized protein YjiS (DUF1127 family)
LEKERLAQLAVRPSLFRFALGVGLLWWHRHRTRRHLSELDAHMLKDIGVSRVDARQEARKWFWQP